MRFHAIFVVHVVAFSGLSAHHHMIRGGESQARECTCESEWHIVLANLWYVKRPMSVACGTGQGPALNCVKHRACIFTLRQEQ